MAELLSINGTTFIPASDAGKICKYTSDYVTRLAREEKILAKRMGRQWYVSPESLEAFIRTTEEQKRARNKKISSERKRELRVFSKNAPIQIEEIELSRPFEPKGNVHVALQQTLIIILLGVSVGYGGYFVASESPQTTSSASVAESGVELLERLALSLYQFVSPKEQKYLTVTPAPQDKEETASSTTNSIVVAPKESFNKEKVEEIRESFSDEVEVVVDPKNPDTGIIVPIFREKRGEDYRFLLLPINPDQHSGT